MKKILMIGLMASAFLMTGCNTSDAEKVCALYQDGQCMAWTTGTTDGTDGLSAYELAVQQGYEGTLNEWLESLNGEAGAEGLSAYQLAVLGGFEGTQDEWIASLQGAAGIPGDPGDPGMSAYELAVMGGFEGTVDEWLISLVGAPGAPGAPGECPCQCEDGNCTCDSNGTVPPIEPCPEPLPCPGDLDPLDDNIHFIIWFSRTDLSDYKMQHLIESGYAPTLAGTQEAAPEGAEGPEADGTGMTVEDRNGTTIIRSVMPLQTDPSMDLQHGMGLQFVQHPGASTGL